MAARFAGVVNDSSSSANHRGLRRTALVSLLFTERCQPKALSLWRAGFGQCDVQAVLRTTVSSPTSGAELVPLTQFGREGWKGVGRDTGGEISQLQLRR